MYGRRKHRDIWRHAEVTRRGEQHADAQTKSVDLTDKELTEIAGKYHSASVKGCSEISVRKGQPHVQKKKRINP